MPSTSLQFHADPREVLDLAAEWSKADGLSVVLERFFPQRKAVRVVGGDFGAAIDELGRVDQVVFGLSELSVVDGVETALVNPDCMVLVVGSLSDKGLRESALGANSSNLAAIAAWRKILGRIRRQLLRGAVLVSWNDDGRYPKPNHRYTSGALALCSAGTAMLAFAGSNTYELGEEA